MRLVEMFQALEWLELAMASLYERLAASHRDDGEASRLFTRLALEEHGHAREVVLQRKLTMQIPRVSLEVPVDHLALLQMREEVAAAATGREKLPLSEVLTLAARLEATAAERHLSTMLSEVDPEIARFVSGLGRGDNDHLERLRAFAATRRIDLP